MAENLCYGTYESWVACVMIQLPAKCVAYHPLEGSSMSLAAWIAEGEKIQSHGLLYTAPLYNSLKQCQL